MEGTLQITPEAFGLSGLLLHSKVKECKVLNKLSAYLVGGQSQRYFQCVDDSILCKSSFPFALVARSTTHPDVDFECGVIQETKVNPVSFDV